MSSSDLLTCSLDRLALLGLLLLRSSPSCHSLQAPEGGVYLTVRQGIPSSFA